MRRDYRLYELNTGEFERLTVRISVRWLGEGVTPFAPGRDGGRDGKFNGKANSFPSVAQPLEGHCVLQAKHVSEADRSCSEKDFIKQVEAEFPKIRRLIAEGICDHYMLFTNRKYSGGADEKLIASLMKLGLRSAHIIGIERLHLALNDYVDIRNTLPNRDDPSPFRFDPNDIVEVIEAIHAFISDDPTRVFKSAFDFEKMKIQQKNKLNGVSADYYQQSIVGSSMPHFNRIADFLENPRNAALANLYHDAADELKQKIITKRDEFAAFDDVFLFMYECVQEKREALKGKRRLITILIHYMYCNCDIGSKEALIHPEAAVHADA